MGPRLRVVEIALQAGESASATSGFCGLSCASGAPGARAGRRDIQIPSFDRIDKYRITVFRVLIRPGIRSTATEARTRSASGTRTSPTYTATVLTLE